MEMGEDGEYVGKYVEYVKERGGEVYEKFGGEVRG